MSLPSKPFITNRLGTPTLTDSMLRLLVQAARLGSFVLTFGPDKGRDCDPEGIEHRRATVKSWGLHGLLSVRWSESVAEVEITKEGVRYLRYIQSVATAGLLPQSSEF